MNLADISDALRKAVETIDGVRVSESIYEAASVPTDGAWVIIKPDEFDAYRADGIPLVMEVWVLVGPNAAGERTLKGDFLNEASPRSLRKALSADPTLGGEVDECRVPGFDSYGTVRFDIDQPAYLGARFPVQILPQEWIP